MPVAGDALLVSQRFGERLPQTDPDVLHGVMGIHSEIGLRANFEVEEPVLGEEGQHVVEKADSGGDRRCPRSLDGQLDPDVGLGRLALNAGAARLSGIHGWEYRRPGSVR